MNPYGLEMRVKEHVAERYRQAEQMRLVAACRQANRDSHRTRRSPLHFLCRLAVRAARPAEA